MRLIKTIFSKRGLERVLFIGEFFWQMDIRHKLRQEMKLLPDVMEVLSPAVF